MLRIIAERTLNLLLLDTAASAKHGEIVVTGASFFFRALREWPQREVRYQIKGLRLGGELPILLYIIIVT
jgi:hypothetical protein